LEKEEKRGASCLEEFEVGSFERAQEVMCVELEPDAVRGDPIRRRPERVVWRTRCSGRRLEEGISIVGGAREHGVNDNVRVRIQAMVGIIIKASRRRIRIACIESWRIGDCCFLVMMMMMMRRRRRRRILIIGSRSDRIPMML
jgi:hypothetical protein